MTMTAAVALSECLSRLQILEDEVSFLKLNAKQEKKWRNRMELWFQTHFDYDAKKSSLQTTVDDENEIDITSNSSVLESKNTSSTNSTRYTSQLKRKFSSTTLRRQYQNILEYSPDKDSITEVEDNDSSSIPYKSLLQTEREISEDLPLNSSSCNGEDDEDSDILWKNGKSEEISVEPSIELKIQGYDDDEDHVEWEILDSDEENEDDMEDQDLKFRVIGYEAAEFNHRKDKNYGPFRFTLDDDLSSYESGISNQEETLSSGILNSVAGSRMILSKPDSKLFSKSMKDLGNITSSSSQGLQTFNVSRLISTTSGLQNTKQRGLQMNFQELRNRNQKVLQPPAKKPQCPWCTKQFNTPAEMHRHQRIHTGEKPYKCYVCEYTTSFNGDLVRHLKSRHPGRDPYVCHICDFKCQDLVHFTDHRRQTGHGGRIANKANKFIT